MPKLVPLVPSNPHYEAGLTIGTVQYRLVVRWNGRVECFFMDLLDVDGNPIRMGMAMVLGTFIGRQCAHADWPGGAFFLVDSSGTGTDAGIDDLGARVLMYHVTDEELEELDG